MSFMCIIYRPHVLSHNYDFCFLSQAETRAEFAERSVAKLEKTIDDLEGILNMLPFSTFKRTI